MLLRMPSPSRRSETSVLWFRKRVPTDILTRARGYPVVISFPAVGSEPSHVVTATIGREVNFSLRTRSPSVAKARTGLAEAHLQKLWEALRNGPRPLTHRQRVALSGEVYNLFAQRFEEDPGSPDQWAAVKAFNRATREGRIDAPPPLSADNVAVNLRAASPWRPDLTSAVNSLPAEEARKAHAMEHRFGFLTDWVLALHGILTDRDSRQKLLEEVDRAATDAAWRLKRNASGDYRPDPNAERFPKWEGTTNTSNVTDSLAPLTFDSLFERWQREVRPAASTVTTFRGQLNQFRKHLGHNEPRRVRRADVIAWKDSLVERGIKRINDGPLGTLNALFNFAVRDGLMESNPAAGIRVAQRVRAGERMQPYEDEEVARILALADKETHPARRWLPWLMALSGARVGELAQLWGERIVVSDGVPVMKIAPAKDGGSLKNAGSERDVPIHPALVKRGFLKFVKQRGNGPLFYRGGQRRGTGRHASKGVANHLADWIRSKGFTDKRKAPNHAFRHWFKTTCLNIGIQDSVADAIQGHVGRRGEADGYRHVTLAMKARAIKRIPVPLKKIDRRRRA